MQMCARRVHWHKLGPDTDAPKRDGLGTATGQKDHRDQRSRLHRHLELTKYVGDYRPIRSVGYPLPGALVDEALPNATGADSIRDNINSTPYVVHKAVCEGKNATFSYVFFSQEPHRRPLMWNVVCACTSPGGRAWLRVESGPRCTSRQSQSKYKTYTLVF